MASVDFSIASALVQGVYFLLLLAIPALIIVSLFKLRKIALPDQVKVLWAVVIILIPILGPLAFLIVKPGSAAGQVQG